mmetsp:Transcript_29690/g.44020  ORF Transcript_29690/g.44020 Transcript_29690/m.44020 type:complete len:327 (+) Transcript_29690:38-1018(+)
MNAKEHRSAKRKAEAIATKEAGCSTTELLGDIENEESTKKRKRNSEGDNQPKKKESSSNPYILFVRQLAYKSTKEGLFQHFQKELGNLITPESLKIRLLTDPKKGNRSRGMAFVELNDPELMHECLKLHHTHLDGRRMNVERSSGGGKNKSKEKIFQFRKEQADYISQTVDGILSEYKAKGDLRKGELDAGVILLCKRHSAKTVEAALGEYVEARGEGVKKNPSSYLTNIIGRIAEYGVETEEQKQKFKRKDSSGGNRPRRGNHGHQDNKRERRSDKMEMKSKNNKAFGTEVDMRLSEMKGGSSSRLSQIFPSMSHGQGRGRGYMR